MSISEVASGLLKDAFSFPSAAKRVFAMGLVEGYVSVMTWAIRPVDRCFRTEDMERSARKVKRASNWATARSSNTKFALMSVGHN